MASALNRSTAQPLNQLGALITRTCTEILQFFGLAFGKLHNVSMKPDHTTEE